MRRKCWLFSKNRSPLTIIGIDSQNAGVGITSPRRSCCHSFLSLVLNIQREIVMGKFCSICLAYLLCFGFFDFCLLIILKIAKLLLWRIGWLCWLERLPFWLFVSVVLGFFVLLSFPCILDFSVWLGFPVWLPIAYGVVSGTGLFRPFAAGNSDFFIGFADLLEFFCCVL